MKTKKAKRPKAQHFNARGFAIDGPNGFKFIVTPGGDDPEVLALAFESVFLLGGITALREQMKDKKPGGAR
jgi:hypothetical protein